MLTFLIELGSKGQLNKLPSMFVDYMHQPWRSLASIINKCLDEKTSSNDRLRKSRMDILWGMFHKKNVDYLELIWEDFQYQIDYRLSKLIRHEIMPYPRFTKLIINHFLSQHISLTKLKHIYINIIKDDGVLNRLRFVIMGEDFQEYGRAIPDTMGKESKGKKAPVTPKKKSLIFVDDNIIPELDVALELGKSIIIAKPTGVEEFDESDGKPTNRPTRRRRQSDSSKGAGITAEVPDELIGKTSSEGAGTVPEVPDEGQGSSAAKVDAKIDWGSEDDSHQSDEEFVNVDDIPWVSTDEEEKGNKDDDDEDEEEDDDRRIDIKETRDQAMADADRNVVEKVEEEKGDEEEKQANDDQDQKDQVDDDVVGTLITMSQKEKLEVPQSSSSQSMSSNYIILSSPTTTTTPTPLTTPLPTTLITTPPITPSLPATEVPDALIPPSEAFNDVLQRVSTLEKDVKELKQVDHSVVIVESIRSQVPLAVNDFLRSSLGYSLKKLLQKHTKELKQEFKEKESHKENEYKQKDILFQMMMASKSYKRCPAHKELYDSLLQSLFVDEDDIDKAAIAANHSTQAKRKYENQDEDPNAGSDQGKEKKRPQKDTQPSNKSSASKESSKDAKENIIDEMGNAKEQPEGEAAPKTDNAPKNNWKPVKAALNSNTTWNNALRLCLIDLIGQTLKILSVVRVKMNKQFSYRYLKEIVMRRADRQLYTSKEGDFVNLYWNDSKDMILLVVKHKLFHLDSDVIIDLAVALRMFTRSLIIKKRVEDI
nr:hypothetical protein [Tanacetum cinerariifolium]